MGSSNESGIARNEPRFLDFAASRLRSE